MIHAGRADAAQYAIQRQKMQPGGGVHMRPCCTRRGRARYQRLVVRMFSSGTQLAYTSFRAAMALSPVGVWRPPAAKERRPQQGMHRSKMSSCSAKWRHAG